MEISKQNLLYGVCTKWSLGFWANDGKQWVQTSVQVWDRRLLSCLTTNHALLSLLLCAHCWFPDYPEIHSSHLYCNKSPHTFPPVTCWGQIGGGHNTRKTFSKEITAFSVSRNDVWVPLCSHLKPLQGKKSHWHSSFHWVWIDQKQSFQVEDGRSHDGVQWKCIFRKEILRQQERNREAENK